METPFKRDVVKELCEAGRRRGLRIALYFLIPIGTMQIFGPMPTIRRLCLLQQSSIRSGVLYRRGQRESSGWRRILPCSRKRGWSRDIGHSSKSC